MRNGFRSRLRCCLDFPGDAAGHIMTIATKEARMSKHSLREKRRQQRLQTDVPPRENDWVYSCPRGMATREIAAALGVVGQPITEVSAQTWQQDAHMANSFMDAYDSPMEWRWPPGEPIGWKLFEEQMLAKAQQTELTASGRIANIRFLGELVIVRRSWEAAETTLAFLLDVMQAHVDRSRKQYHSHARIMLVLEGWERLIITGKIGKQVVWAVNPVPPAPSP